MCIPDLGWEQSGGESAPAVAGAVYRLWARRSAGARSGRTVESVSWGGCEGRHKAGTYGDLMGLGGRGLAGHFRLGTRHQYRHQVDEACCWGGRCGGGAPAQGRADQARPPRKAVVSGQWSETGVILAETGMGTDHGLGASRGKRKFAPILGCTLAFGVVDRTSQKRHTRCYRIQDTTLTRHCRRSKTNV